MRQRGRSKRLYSQAHLAPVEPSAPSLPPPQSDESQTLKRTHKSPEKRRGETKEKIVTLPPAPAKEESPAVLPQTKPPPEEKKEEPPVFPMEPYIVFHAGLDQSILMSLLDVLRGKKGADGAKQQKLKGNFMVLKQHDSIEVPATCVRAATLRRLGSQREADLLRSSQGSSPAGERIPGGDKAAERAGAVVLRGLRQPADDPHLREVPHQGRKGA